MTEDNAKRRRKVYKIADTCVGCHRCALECPAHAISFYGMKYEINQDACVECGLCERICPTCSISDPDASDSPEAHNTIVRECDLVVCGAGTGLIAAVLAAQTGKKVLVLEKACRIGGNADLAHGFFPVYTKMHREAGLADLREEAIEVFWERAGKKLDKEVVRTAVYGCGEFFDWLCGISDAEKDFELVPLGDVRAMGPMYSSGLINLPTRMYENLLCRDMAIGPGWAGTYVKHKLLDQIRNERLDVEILTHHEAKHLLTDESGTVRGVLAQDPGGHVEIHAHAVILATGGFGRSDDKLQRYFNFFDCETPIHRFSVKSNTGDAIDMLQEMGVEPDPDRLFVSIFGPAHHPFSYCLYRILEHPSCVSVNLNGKRWQDESGGLMEGRFKIMEQPKEIAWGIFDQANIDRIGQEYINDPKLREETWIYETYQEDLEEEIALPKPPVLRDSTLEGLARQIGIDPRALTDTIKRYNAMCERGIDEEFGKAPEHLRPIVDGPYYAIYGQCFSEAACGGLRVNKNCEVTREDGTVIPGLYGVGDATSAMHRRGELAPISELTWAVASSFVSGKNAAVYAEGTE